LKQLGLPACGSQTRQLPFCADFHVPATNAKFENMQTDATGIARMSTKRWEPIQVTLPRPLAAGYGACRSESGRSNESDNQYWWTDVIRRHRNLYSARTVT
jgi:hypothetical protein